jgi:hypothetical protein
MSDAEFCRKVDQLLWETVPEGRNNAINYALLQQLIEDAREVSNALKDLVDALYSGCLWFEHPHIAVPLLHALYVLQEQSGSTFEWGKFVRAKDRSIER